MKISLFCALLASATLWGNYVSYSVVDHYDEETEEEAQPLPKKAAAKKPAAKNPPAKTAAASAKSKRKPTAEEENGADEGSDEDEDEKPKKKRKRATGATGGGSALSPEMQEFLGVERMARPQVWPLSVFSWVLQQPLSKCFSTWRHAAASPSLLFHMASCRMWAEL